MSQLGERLREAREAQGVTLAQAAAETRILQRYLVALEDGDYQHLPGDVYARGFIRNYAHYLNIPSEELIELYRRDRGVTDPIRVMAVTSAPRVRNLFVPSFFGVFFVVLSLVGLSYLVLNATNRIGENARAVAEAPTAVPTPPAVVTARPAATLPVVAVAPTITPRPLATEGAGGLAPGTVSATSTPEVPISGEIRIAAGKRSWMDIRLDGASVFRGTLEANASRQFSAKRQVEILLGNAGAVSITINGQQFASLGGDGKPVTFRWPR